MRKLPIFLLLSVLWAFGSLSCSKGDSNDPPKVLDSKISFDVNGISVVWSGEKNARGRVNIRGLRLKQPGTSITKLYQFLAEQDDSNGGDFSLYTDSLIAKTYHQDSPSPAFFHINNQGYGGGVVPEYMDYVITSHKNGIVNGTFSGKVLANNGQMVDITNGVLKDIRMYYPQ